MSLLVSISTYLALVIYLISIYLHKLIINKKISYKDVNGGRSETYEEQRKQSEVSIIILSIMFLYVFISSMISSYNNSTVYLLTIVILVVFWLLGTIMQLLGTKFEKQVVVWINITGLISHAIILIDLF